MGVVKIGLSVARTSLHKNDSLVGQVGLTDLSDLAGSCRPTLATVEISFGDDAVQRTPATLGIGNRFSSYWHWK